MANLPETETYAAGVYQIETTDPVIGGPTGINNKAAKNLADRTKWLKARVDELVAFLDGDVAIDGEISADSAAITGALAAASATITGTLYASGVSVSGVVSAASLSAASAALTGAVTAATVTASGNIGGALITASAGLKAAASGNGAGTLTGMRFGTWTPTISATGGGSASGVTSEGQYSRIGNMVFFSFKLAFTKSTLSGSLRIGGLPYAVDNLGAASNVSVGQAMTDGSTVLAVGATAISPMLQLIVDPSAGTQMQPQMHSHDHSSTSNHPSLAAGNITSSDCLLIGYGHYYTEAAW